MLEKQVARLIGPADDLRQDQVDKLCETLGIITIDVSQWTILEAAALVEELMLKAKKFESKE